MHIRTAMLMRQLNGLMLLLLLPWQPFVLVLYLPADALDHLINRCISFGLGFH